MSPVRSAREVVLAVESAASPREGTRVLRENGAASGFCAAYAERVIELMGSDLAAARHLASYWKAARRHGDEPAQALRVRAIQERLRGRWLAAAEAFVEAGECSVDAVEALSLQIGAVDCLARAGRVDQALRLGKRLAIRLESRGRPDLAARAKLNVGNAFLWVDKYDRACSWLREATSAFQVASLPVEAAMAQLGLSTAELFGGFPLDAEGHAQEAIRTFESLNMGHYADLCKLNLAHAAILLGRADEALQVLAQLHATMEDVAGTEAVRICEFLGDTYFALNLYQEANRSFRDALRSAFVYEMPLNRANCWFGLGVSQSAQGEHIEARRCLRRSVALYEELGNDVWAGAGETAIAESYLASGQVARAERYARRATQKSRSSPFHLAKARLAHADSLIRLRARPENLLRQTERAVRKHLYRGLSWRIHYLRALMCDGSARSRHFRRMLQSILEDRAITRSSISQTHFLRNKEAAIGEYLDHLLSQPTRRSVSEAIAVVQQCRSVALIDEILAAHAGTFGELSAETLQELRAQLQPSRSAEDKPGSARRAAVSASDSVAINQKWLTLSHRIRQATAEHHNRQGDRRTAIMIERGESLYAIHKGHAWLLSATRSQVAEALLWMRFEMLDAQLDSAAPSIRANQELAQLKAMLLDPWMQEGETLDAICPDGILWSVPWNALLGPSSDGLVLLPGPGFSSHGAHAQLAARSRTAIWAHAPANLPAVSDEVRAVQQAYPDAKVFRTIDDVRGEALNGSWDLIHVACHAYHNSDNPMFSYLEFDGGPLYAWELASSNFQVKVAVLSACDTGAVSTAIRYEPDGLARAFLARGAYSVLASSWPLDDDGAAKAMSCFYQSLGSGIGVGRSLTIARTQAQLERPHPYFWGNFVLFGGYRAS